MRLRTAGALALTGLALAGCFGPRWAAGPEGLVYGEPDPNPAAYTFADSATLEVQASGYGAVRALSTRRGTAELAFRRAPAGYEVHVRFPRLDVRFRDVTGETATAGEDDLGGPLGLEVGYRGTFAVVDTPAVEPRLLEISDLAGLVRPFFVPLPGRTVTPGDRWSDTVRTRHEEAGTATHTTFITVATLVGDTAVAGRRLLRIGTETTMETRLSGVAGGVEVEQRTTARLEGRVLWDEAARLLVERVEAGRLEGTLSMPGTGVDPIPVAGRISHRVSLRR